VAGPLGPAASLLAEGAATRKKVEEGLGTARHLLLACHGKFEPYQPLASHLVLNGGEQPTLADLLGRRRLSGTRLVVLAACETAVTDFAGLPEEALGLPAGFLQAGAVGVVGSLWPVPEGATALLIWRLYTALLRGGFPPAQALATAQRWLRDVTCEALAVPSDEFGRSAEDSRAAAAMAGWLRGYVLAPDPDRRPSRPPYYWAGFSLTGL